MPHSGDRPQAERQTVRTIRRIDNIRRFGGASMLAIVLTSLYLNQPGAPTENHTNPLPIPVKPETPPPLPETKLAAFLPDHSLPIEVLIHTNLAEGHPFKQSLLDARYPRSGVGSDAYLERCVTADKDHAFGVTQDNLGVRATIDPQAPILATYHKGDTIAYRLRLVMTRFRSRLSNVLVLTEDGKNFNTVNAIRNGQELIKNLPQTKCEPVEDTNSQVK